MNRLSRCSTLWILIFFLLDYGTPRATLATEDSALPRLIVSASHTALSGNLPVLILRLPITDRSTIPTTTENVDIVMVEEEEEEEEEEDEEEEEEKNNPRNSKESPLVLRVLRLDGFTSELVGKVPVETAMPTVTNNVSLTIPCGFFSRGGTYSLQLQSTSSILPERLTSMSNLQDQTKTILDVRWPTPSLSLEPQHFKTYPDQPVLVTLEYTGISCTPSAGVPITTYSMQLIYCGSSVISCDPRNKSHVQTLYSEEVKGFPIQKVVTLRCEFFGLAGHYALRLKPSDDNPSAPTTSAYIKVEWSDQFVFNIHARSVYPCDGGNGGVSVLFEYPSCRLQGDRVRVYGRLRADVASLAPPSTLHYVAELKAPPGKHTLTFDCDIFTERFVEYCFVYVSQAITGAMAEVRVDCIPTFPLQDGDAGGWGTWSQWTPCSSSCVGGTRNRYRFCDNPPPRYGAKFCQGKAVETESCGGSSQLDLRGTWNPGDWECRHGKGLAAERPEVSAEVGTKCRCGCVVNLVEDKPRKILAASTQACPGRSFWLIQTDPKFLVKLRLDQAKFPCPGQYVRARDGDSLNAELLADVAFDKNAPSVETILSSEQSLLLEFFSDEMVAVGESCVGGFLAHVTLFPKSPSENNSVVPTALFHPSVMAAGRWALWLTPAHLVAASLLILMFLVSLFLVLQYALKYRKYQIAEDLDSLTDNSVCSGSMQGLAKRARALSSATLISEVVSLVRLPRRGSPRHARLEETPGDLEDGYESTETQAEVDDGHSGDSGTLKLKETEDNGSQGTMVPSEMSTPTRLSISSGTLIPGQPEVKFAHPVKLRTVGPISPVSEETSISDGSRRYSVTSASTSVNNVRVPHPKSSTLLQGKGFSPASTSSNASTLRCGKDSKERRNRERLLQGPGSEFSLANPDLDLELDYYDYNVVNAGAAPGSYLGMDPAFLIWIPPLDPGESEALGAIEEDHHYEEIPDRERIEDAGSGLRLDAEGAALTPAEYNKLIKSSKLDDHRRSFSIVDRGQVTPRKLDPGECRLHDEIISEYRTRLSEGMLPIHRILEESRVRVSEESLTRQCGQQDEILHNDIIPNRLIEDNDTEEKQSEARTKFTPKTTRNRLLEEQERSRTPGIGRRRIHEDHHRSRTGSFDDRERDPRSSTTNMANNKHCGGVRGRIQGETTDQKGKIPDDQDEIQTINAPAKGRLLDLENESSKILSQKRTGNNQDTSRARRNRAQEIRDLDRDLCETKEDGLLVPTISRTPSVQQRYRDVIDLNAICEAKRAASTVNIPLREFPRGRLQESPVKVHARTKDGRKEVLQPKEIQSPDYGVEADMKEESRDSFYDLIGEGQDGLKFADDEEEYIDNKVTA